MILHAKTHPTYVEGCFGCKAASIRVAAAATPNRRQAYINQQGAWDQTMADDDAYKRLRKDGLQPRSTKGCAELERIDDRNVIEGLPKLWNEREEHLLNPTSEPMTMTELAEKAESL